MKGLYYRVILLLLILLPIGLIYTGSKGYWVTHYIVDSEISPVTGHAFSIELEPPFSTWLKVKSDGNGPNAYRSYDRLFENGILMDKAHSNHADIVTYGKGRFSHWEHRLIFSSTNNSDPRKNGNRYRIEYPVYIKPVISVVIALIFIVLSFCLLYKKKDHFSVVRAKNISALFKLRTDQKHPVSIGKRTAYYLLCIVALYATFSADIAPGHYAPSMMGGVLTKIPYMEEYGRNYNLVFIGDSRTYCGFHPDLIDMELGTRSINIAQFAHWLPTQYPMIQDLIPTLAPDATVVWSVGHQNFMTPPSIQNIYPIGVGLAIQYLLMGYPFKDIWENASFFNPFLHLLADRKEQKAKLLSFFSHEAAKIPGTHSMPTANAAIQGKSTSYHENGALFGDAGDEKRAIKQKVAAIMAKYSNDENITDIQVLRDHGKVTSVVLYRKGGSYYRVELDHAFFLAKRAELLKRMNAPYNDATARNMIAGLSGESNPYLLKTFKASLSAFKKAGIHLVVSEIQEAPHHYGHPLIRAYWHKFMHEKIRPIVESYGFDYIEPDFTQLNDDDYFDYNHLNSIGIKKFTPLIASALRSHLNREH